VERLNSGSYCDTSPRKVLLEQLSRLLPADDSLPDQVAKNSEIIARHLPLFKARVQCRTVL
jgi:hypothetical protein